MTDDRELLVEAVRALARERIAPRAAEVDRTAEFPWDAVELLRENDVFALAFPEEYGGTGTGFLTHLRAVEELSWADATVGLVLAVQGLGGLPVLLAGTAEQKQAYVPRWASGEWIAAYALTEPAAGSDAQALGTRARREGDDWVLDGTKRFITNAGVAHTYVVFARAEAGITAFMVEATDPGFSVGRIEPKMGIKGSTTGELLMDACRIPGDRLIGAEGEGFEGARGLLYRVANMLDDGVDGPELTKLAAMCKLACSDAAMEVTTDAVQILGGYGYIQEYPVERMMRDAKITQIYEGTNQIQRVVIARELLRDVTR